MNTDPETPARQILEIITGKYRCKANGTVKALGLQIELDEKNPGVNFSVALGCAVEKGWIEPGRQPGFVTLTQAGYEEIIMMEGICKEIVAIQKADGTLHENVKANISSVAIFPNDKVPLEYGDLILRPVPGGAAQRLYITDPGYILVGQRGHYQARFRHEGSIKDNRSLNVHVSGPNSRFNYNSTDNSTNIVHVADLDFPVLSEEFGRLREALLAQKPTTVEQFSALAKIAEAEAAAKKEDSSSVINALTAMGKVAGKWAYDAGMEFSAKTAAELISKYAVG